MTHEDDLIATLTPALAALCRQHLAMCRAAGIDARVVQARRTDEEQAALYAKGRTAPGPVVTHAATTKDTAHGPGRDGLGLAYDIAVWPPGSTNPSWAPLYFALYDQAGRLGEGLGLEWGGRWPEQKRDRPHFQVPGWRALKGTT